MNRRLRLAHNQLNNRLIKELTVTVDKARQTSAQRSRRNGVTGGILVGFAAVMVGVAFASEPLYKAFCRVTGYGGTTQVAVAGDQVASVSNKLVTVRFDANVNRSLPWRFLPVQREVRVQYGQQALAFFEATNVSDKPIVGTATFNVVPYKAGSYFNKIDCFCFTEQVLAPGQTVQMPVTFYVDPKMIDDRNTSDVKTITLSYTFFADDDQSAAEKLRTSQIMRQNKGSKMSTGGLDRKG